MSKKLIISLTVGALVALMFALIFLLGSSASTTMENAGTTVASQQAPGPVMLDGHWHQTSSGISSIKMSAEISNGHIQITANLSDTADVYWIGTFDSTYHETPAFKVVSNGDTDAMASDLFASQDASKTFTYENGDLSFPFSIMGMSTTVHLARGA